VDIGFKDRDMRRLCEDEKLAIKKLGKLVAKKLRARLNALQAAANRNELPAGNPPPLKREFEGCIGITLEGGYRLVIRPANNPLPLRPGGDLDRQRVTIVTIEYIGDYHD